MNPLFSLLASDGAKDFATLRLHLSIAEVEDADDAWVPVVYQETLRLLQAGVPRRDLPEHKHWMWSMKARRYHAVPGYVFGGLYTGGEAQGLILMNNLRECREPSQRNDALIYVDYLSTAPWNLPVLVATPRFRGVGRALIQAAIAFSEENGFAGRIGLHSLPQAEAFYRDTCGMTDLGNDPSEYDLRYFEMTAAQVAAFSRA